MIKLHQKALTILVAGAGLAGLASAQDVNQADCEGKTLLMRAADRGLTAEVKRLLATGAQVNTKDNDGETALMMAADEGNAAVVKLLLLGIGKLFSFLPVSLEMEYLSETILIIVPIAIVCFFGFARTFKTGSFIRGLICCLPFVVLQLIMLAVVLTDALGDPEANWRSWYVIVLGIYSTIGIGIREECIYRATIQNIIA